VGLRIPKADTLWCADPFYISRFGSLGHYASRPQEDMSTIQSFPLLTEWSRMSSALGN